MFNNAFISFEIEAVIVWDLGNQVRIYPIYILYYRFQLNPFSALVFPNLLL